MVTYGMEWDVSWNVELSIGSTIVVRGVSPIIVKNFQLLKNQQVTKTRGVSRNLREHMPANLNITEEERWNEWLGGLIDGDGSLLVSKEGYTSCEITMGLEDEYALQQVKKRLGGSIKPRSGAKAIRYRLHNRKGMEELIRRINGKIRYWNRKEQMEKVCQVLGIRLEEPKELKKGSGWTSGLWDSDGTITLKRDTGQITVSITNKWEKNVECLSELGGRIYYDKSLNGYYRWSVQDREGVLKVLEEIKGSKSGKRRRLFLVEEVYKLKDLGAHKSEEGSLKRKAWERICERWNKNHKS